MSRLALPKGVSLPAELRRELTQLDLRLRWVSFVRGLGALLFVTLLLAAGFLIADFLMPLSGTIRFLFLAALTTTFLWLGFRWLVTPLTRQRRWPELAYLIDRSFPDLQERVSSTVELSLVPEAQRGIASEFMWQRLQQETDRKLSGLDLWECLSLSSMAAALFAGLLTLVAASSPLLWNAGGYSLLWQRLLTPWENLDSATNLTFVVEGGDAIVPRGDDFLIHAKPQWRYSEGTLPREIRLSWTAAGERPVLREMSYDSRLGAYVGKIPQVTEPVSYYLHGAGARSRIYQVQVADRPRIVDVTLTVEPPAYTQMKSAEHEGAIGTIRAIEGSRLIAQLRFEHPVEQVSWKWSTSRVLLSPDAPTAGASSGGKGSVNTKQEQASSTPAAGGPSTSRQVSLSGIVAADGLSARIEATADQSDTFLFDAVSSAGLHNINEPQRMIQVISDRPPRIEVSGSNEPLKVRSDEVVPIEMLADDDFGVVELEVVVEHLTSGLGNPPIQEWASSQTGPTVRRVNDRFELNLGLLSLKNGDILGYRAVARDGRPDPRPNEVWTSRRVLLISEDVKSLAGQEVEDFYTAIRRQVDVVKNEVAAHRKEVERNREELDPTPRDLAKSALQEKKPGWTQTRLALSLQLDDLTRKLQQRPITTALAAMNSQPAQSHIDQAADRLEKFSSASQTDPLETIRADEKDIREAENLLNRLLNQLRDAERIEQELTELQQLARRAKTLASQAAEMNRPQPDPGSEKSPEKSAPADQPQPLPLDQLEQEYAALNHDLENLLNRRPELKQAAKNALLSDLGEASDLAAQLADQQQRLTEALEAARAQDTPEQAPVAARLAETLKLAQQLAARSEQEAGQDAAPVYDTAPTGRAIDQQEQANLGRVSEALQQARETLERFQAAKQAAAALPEDAAAAARELAQRSQELARQAQQWSESVKAADKQQKDAAEQARREQRPVPTETRSELAEKQAALRQEQQQLGEQIAGLMQATANLPTPPQQKWQQPDIIEQLDRAQDELTKRTEQVDDRLKDAARKLEELAKNVGTAQQRAEKSRGNRESIEKQAEQLRQQVAEALKNQTPETPVDPARLQEFSRLQRDQARQLMQQDTLNEEERLAAAVQQALKTAEKFEKHELAEAAAGQEDFARQVQALNEAIRQAAEKPADNAPQQTASGTKTDAQPEATSEAKSEDKSEKSAPQKAAWDQVELPEDLRKQRFPVRDDEKPEVLAQKLDELIEAQRKLNEQTAKTAAEMENLKPEDQKNQLRPLADQQRQLADRAEHLRGPVGALPRMQAQQAQRDAAAELQEGKAEAAQQEQKQAVRQLEQARQQLADATGKKSETSTPPAAAAPEKTDEPTGPDQQSAQQPAASPPPEAGNSPAPPSSEELAEQLATKLAQLEQELNQAAGAPSTTPPTQSEMTEAAAQDTPPSASPAGESPAPASSSAANSPVKGSPAGNPAASPAENEPQAQIQNMVDAVRETQQRIADQARQLSEQTQSLAPEKKELQQTLKQASEQAQQAAQKMETGQFEKAAEQSQAASEQLAAAAEQKGVNQAAQAAAETLARQQADLAAQVQQLAQNRAASAQARQQLQQQMNAQADNLTESLNQFAEQSRAKPLNDRHNADQMQQLSRQSEQAAANMQQALADSQQGNLQESSGSSAQAQQQLADLAQQSAKLADMKRETLVPEPVGAEAAAAARTLAQAREALQRAREQAQQQAMEQTQVQPPASADNANSSPPANDPSGRQPAPPASGQNPAAGSSGSPAVSGQSTPAPPGTTPPGNTPPANSPLDQLSRELAQAAQALQQAHQMLQPREQPSSGNSQAQSQPSSSGQPSESSDATAGNQSPLPADGPMSGELLRSALMRDWGQRLEALDAELSDSRRRGINQDYAPLIQRYLEAIASPEATPAPAGTDRP